jgi:hypothetical protein
MDGDDGDDLHLRDAEDLVGPVGRPPHLPESGDQQVPAVPQQP